MHLSKKPSEENSRFAISGGAPLGAELGSFFANMGIKVLEGYGLTETFAAITVNTESQKKWRLGTVGRPIGDVDIRFDEDGEILVNQKNLKEYYKNSEATAEAFKDGYFRTGDIGEFTSDGFLKITDRKKDLIKTAGGKYVAPLSKARRAFKARSLDLAGSHYWRSTKICFSTDLGRSRNREY